MSGRSARRARARHRVVRLEQFDGRLDFGQDVPERDLNERMVVDNQDPHARPLVPMPRERTRSPVIGSGRADIAGVF